MSMSITLAVLLSLFAAPAPLTAPALLDVRIDPLMDMHHWVRRLAERKGELSAVAGLPDAVAAARRLDDELGSPLTWSTIDGAVSGAGNAEGFAKIAVELPESMPLPGGRTVRLREGAMQLAAAYQALEKPFLAAVWPRHREAVETAAAVLRRDLLPKAPAIYADIAEHLRLPVPARPIPVVLVAEGPFPGAVTHRLHGGGTVSIVAANAAQGTQWLETVVHETLHALDVSAEGSVLDELRDRLGKVEPKGSPKEIHDFVHTLMFVQAAVSIRRVIDPAHKDYGDVNGYYPKVPRATAVVVPAWRAYLNGEISRDAAIARIVDGFAKPPGGG